MDIGTYFIFNKEQARGEIIDGECFSRKRHFLVPFSSTSGQK